MSVGIDQLATLPGNTPVEVCIILTAMAGPIPPEQAIIAAGVGTGKSLTYLAFGADYGAGARVYGIDPGLILTVDGPVTVIPPMRRPAPQRALTKFGLSDRVTLMARDPQSVADTWQGPGVGLLYIDRDHSYDGVRADIAAWMPHLHPGALIVVNGYGGEIVKDARRAVDDLVDEGTLTLVEVRHNRLAILTVPATEPKTDLDKEPDTPLPVGEHAPAEPPAPVEPEEEPPGLDTLTVPVLVELAGKRGVELQGGMRKAEILDALRQAGVEETARP